jgi:hypothetical protein
MYLKVLLTYFAETLVLFPALFIFGVCPCRIKGICGRKKSRNTLEASS